MKFRHWPCFDLENVWDLFFFLPLFFSHLFWEFCEFLLRRPSWSTVTGLWIQSLNPNLTNQPLSTWSWSTATEMQYSSLDGLALCDLLHYLWHPLWFPSGRERQEASGYGLKVLRAESWGGKGGEWGRRSSFPLLGFSSAPMSKFFAHFKPEHFWQSLVSGFHVS